MDGGFTVGTELLKVLGEDPVDPLVYRDRTMLALPPESVVRISLQRKEERQTVVRAESGEWRVAELKEHGAAVAVIDDILFHVSNLRAIGIKSHNPETLSIYGLDSPGAVLTLGVTGKEGIQKSILTGFLAGVDGVYAMLKGQDLVFVLNRSLAEKLTRDIAVPFVKSKEQ